LVYYYFKYSGKKKNDHHRIVILSNTLTHDCNVGYDINNILVLTDFNGSCINNLKDLKENVDKCSDDYLTFGFDYNKRVIILDHKISNDSEIEILKNYNIDKPFLIYFLFFIISFFLNNFLTNQNKNIEKMDF
jgi:hypothetical protein